MMDVKAHHASTLASLGRPVAAVGAALLAVALAALATSGRVPGGAATLLGGLAALVAAVLILNRIETGLLCLPVVATLVPWSIGTGRGSSLVAGLLLGGALIALWIAHMLVRRDLVVARSAVNAPLVGFGLTAILATIFSDVERDPLIHVWPSFHLVQVGGLAVMLISIGILLMALNIVRHLAWIAWVTWILLGLGAITIVAFLLRSHEDMPGAAVGGLFSTWVIALAFSQVIFNRRLAGWLRLVLLALVAAWLYRRFFLESAWISGWLPALVAVVTISLLKSVRLLLVSLAAIALVAALNLGFILTLYQQQTEGDDSQGNYTRLDVWQRSFEVGRAHLLLGTGPGGYAPHYMTFSPTRAMSSHSNYMDIFAQTGLIGSFFFAWFLVAMLRVGGAVRRQWRDGFGAGFANGALGGLVAMMVAMGLGDWVLPFAYNQTIEGFRYTVQSWLLLGLLASMHHMPPE
jgi:hypothetical protein